MDLKSVSPAEAAALMTRGALLVDIREAAEHRRERIPGARHVPLSELQAGRRRDLGPASDIVFHCRSGARTATHAQVLAGLSGGKAHALAGGIEAWRRSGLPVARREAAKMPLHRQIWAAAGGLVLLGIVLGYAVAPAFFLLSGLVGAGLLQAGFTGWCGLEALLRRMPWNRPAEGGTGVPTA